MYIAGNFKQKIKQIFKREQTHFIWASVSDSTIYLLEVKLSSPVHIQIMRVMSEIRQNDDEYFYSECIHKFVHEYKLYKLPIYIVLDEDLLLIKNYILPKMPKQDLSKTLHWELSEFRADFTYAHMDKLVEDKYEVEVFLCAKTFIKQWRNICKSQPLTLMAITNLRKTHEVIELAKYTLYTWRDTTFNLGFDEECLNLSIDVDLIVNNLIPLSVYIQSNSPDRLMLNLLPAKYIASRINWQYIYASVTTVLMAISICVGSFMYSNYYVLTNREHRLQEDIQLLKEDKNKIEAIKSQEEQLTQKRELIKNIYAQSSAFYPLIVGLGSSTHREIKLMAVELNDKDIIIQGKALNYNALTAYKQQLNSIKFVNNIELETSNISEQDRLIDFKLRLNEDK